MYIHVEVFFIDFNDLLFNEDPTPATFSLDSDGNLKTNSGAGGKKNKKLTWPDWCSAWNTFLAVLCDGKKDPALPALLAKHFETVQDLARNNKDWSHYDSGFRQLLTLGLTKWGEIHCELLSEARNRSNIQSGNWSRARPWSIPTSEYPHGFCISYHKYRQCSSGMNCHFNHTCFNCQGFHPFVSCWKQVTRPFRPHVNPQSYIPRPFRFQNSTPPRFQVPQNSRYRYNANAPNRGRGGNQTSTAGSRPNINQHFGGGTQNRF